MSDFVILEEKWKLLVSSQALRPLLEDKLSVLLHDPNEDGVASALSLLTSFGEESLCEVLCFENDQVCLREDLGITHRLLWEKGILELVSKEGSIWSGLYESDHFSQLEFRVLGSCEWSTLSQRHQDIVLKESFRMVDIPSGTFMMGALDRDEDAYDSEKPRHEVTLTKGFRMCMYLCTQGLYESVMGNNPSTFKGSTRPVEEVSWCDAVLFCNRLSTQEGLEPVYELPQPFQNDDDWSKGVKWNQEANGYRLPTEAEWEYWARAGQDTIYSGSDDLDEVGWYWVNSGRKTHPVGQKKSNGFGLYDMSGNVFEWVWDPWKLDAYDRGDSIDPIVDELSPARVLRGGSWFDSARLPRVSFRRRGNASARVSLFGFRILRRL